MHGAALQDILSRVQQDDLERASKKHEADKAAAKAARLQAGIGLSATDLLAQLSAEEDDPAAEQEALVLHKKETPDAPKRTATGYFPAPPK